MGDGVFAGGRGGLVVEWTSPWGPCWLVPFECLTVRSGVWLFSCTFPVTKPDCQAP